MSVLLLPQLLRWNSQGAIEFTRRVLPGDRRGQLNQRIVIIKFTQARKQFIAYFPTSDGHCVGKLQGDPLGPIKQLAVRVIQHRVDLVVGNSEAAAHGSVDVLSKFTAIQESHATINEGTKSRID